MCGYNGMLNPEYDWDTEDFKHWAEKHNIDIVFRCISTETFANYDIERITIPSFKFKRFPDREGFRYNDRHGVELHYKDEEQELLVGFIEGYQWYHMKRGPVRIYILTQDSKEWGELRRKSNEILDELKEAIYAVLKQQTFRGRIKGNIYGLPNA